MEYNPASWDFMGAQDDFGSMLETSFAHSGIATGPGHRDLTTLDPTRFPAPQAEADTPPASEESSPSPPSPQEREAFERRQRKRSGHFDSEAKRKVDDISDSDDSTYGQQIHKAQHRSDNHAIRKTSGTKKSGTKNPDENRALKRKEQNRAAQRAFRERKERHVRELEEQVAALEAKTQSQDRENENLRDLLGRLQNENLLLKQSAFTFSFPSDGSKGSSPSAPANASKPSASTRQDSSPSLSSPSSSSNASSPENTTSNNAPQQSTLFARADSSYSSESSSDSSPRSDMNRSAFVTSSRDFGLGTNSTPAPVPDATPIDFSGIPGLTDLQSFEADANRKPGQPQTIASNPMYMSYANDPFNPLAWASFGPSDYVTAPVELQSLESGLQADYNGTIPAFGNGMTTLEDIFGSSAPTSAPSLYHLDSSSSVGGGTYSVPSPSAGSGISGEANAQEHSGEHSEGGCPKSAEDVRRMQQGVSPSTFGPHPTAQSPPPTTSVSPAAVSANNEKNEACAHARMAALCADLPRTTKKPNQIEIGRAWEKIRQSKGFEECDIDELCNELSAKARCDGSRPVIEETSFNDIVNSLPRMYKH